MGRRDRDSAHAGDLQAPASRRRRAKGFQERRALSLSLLFLDIFTCRSNGQIFHPANHASDACVAGTSTSRPILATPSFRLRARLPTGTRSFDERESPSLSRPARLARAQRGALLLSTETSLPVTSRPPENARPGLNTTPPKQHARAALSPSASPPRAKRAHPRHTRAAQHPSPLPPAPSSCDA